MLLLGLCLLAATVSYAAPADSPLDIGHDLDPSDLFRIALQANGAGHRHWDNFYRPRMQNPEPNVPDKPLNRYWAQIYDMVPEAQRTLKSEDVWAKNLVRAFFGQREDTARDRASSDEVRRRLREVYSNVDHRTFSPAKVSESKKPRLVCDTEWLEFLPSLEGPAKDPEGKAVKNPDGTPVSVKEYNEKFPMGLHETNTESWWFYSSLKGASGYMQISELVGLVWRGLGVNTKPDH